MLLWSVDLSQDQDFSKRSNAEDFIGLRPPTIDFVDSEHVVVAFDDSSRSVPTSTQPEMRPFGFHVLEVAAATGKPGRKLSFKVVNDTSQAMAIGEGNLLVLSGEKLEKFSASLKALASYPTPLKLHGQATPVTLASGTTYMNPRRERWQMDLAPGESKFILVHENFPEAEIQWLGTADFKKTATATVEGPGLKSVFAGNDSALIFVHNNPPLLVSSTGKQKAACDCRTEMARFLTDDLMFLAMKREYKIITTLGEVRSTGKLKVGATNFYRARESSRFAYTTGYYKGSGFPLQTKFAPRLTVRVFDWNTMKQIEEVDFEEPGIPEKAVSTGFRQSAVALSPDGRHLLVLINSKLNCYQLP